MRPLLFALALLGCTLHKELDTQEPVTQNDSAPKEDSAPPTDQALSLLQKELAQLDKADPRYPGVLYQVCALTYQRAQAEPESTTRAEIYSRARDCFLGLAQNFPAQPKGDEILFMLGDSYWMLRQSTEALAAFKELFKRYPQSLRVPEAMMRYADAYFEAKDFPSALTMYQKVITYPNTPLYGRAIYQIGCCYARQSKHQDALSRFMEATSYSRLHPELIDSAALEKDALNALIISYVPFGDPSKAEPFFLKAGGQAQLVPMLEKLVTLYQANANPQSAQSLCQSYSAAHPGQSLAGCKE